MPITIRPATAADQPTIQRIVRAARINPTAIDWRRFLVAESDGVIVGIGQVKPHRDGSRELASIATTPSHQRHGIASQVIRALLAREQGALYLVCQQSLENFYARFGFRRVARDEMTPYFRLMHRTMRFWGGIVMKRSGE